MRRILFIVIVMISIVIMIKNTSVKNQEIRVRVVPNSNNIEDMYNKNIAKDITIAYLYNAYNENYNIYINNINEGLVYLKEGINKYIDDDISISFDNHTLYNKTYNSMVIENSTNLTLLIILGDGKGENWWGTVYPDFLLVNGNEVVKYESLFVKLFNKTSEDYDD